MRKFFSRLLVLIMAVIATPHPSFAEELTVTREVFLERGMTPQSNVIIRTNDNGFVIAGFMNGMKQAWATRTDAEGNVKWRYTAPLLNKSADGLDPAYNSAAIMPDDSVFLCGNMTGEFHPGLLTHLDKDGTVLSEQLISSKVDGKVYGGPILSCATWQTGVALVGVIADIQHVEPTKTHPLPYDGKYYYWILYVDYNGQTTWEKLVPVAAEFAGLPTVVSPLQVTSDGGFVFAASRFGTEVVQVAPNGDVHAKTYIKELSLTLSRPTENDAELKLISTDTTSGTGPLPTTLVTLDGTLKEISRITQLHEAGVVRQAYHLPDQSLVLFGSIWRQGHSSFARVTKLDSKLQHEEVLDLTTEPNSSFWVSAAVPLDKPGQFACVRSVLKPLKNGETVTGEKYQEARFGVALDFISLKPSN